MYHRSDQAEHRHMRMHDMHIIAGDRRPHTHRTKDNSQSSACEQCLPNSVHTSFCMLRTRHAPSNTCRSRSNSLCMQAPIMPHHTLRCSTAPNTPAHLLPAALHPPLSSLTPGPAPANHGLADHISQLPCRGQGADQGGPSCSCLTVWMNLQVQPHQHISSHISYNKLAQNSTQGSPHSHPS